MKSTAIFFTAYQLVVDEPEPGVFVLRFMGKDHYLTLGRRESGEPGPYGDLYFECDNQGHGGYDVVQEVRVGEVHVEVILPPAVAAGFSGRRYFRVDVDVPQEKWLKVRVLLLHLLRDRPQKAETVTCIPLAFKVPEEGLPPFQLE
ncbi:MAG: hypothetical protein ACAI34_14060 [Verrucomicrobium sp.]